jgi:hypothetical protein
LRRLDGHRESVLHLVVLSLPLVVDDAAALLRPCSLFISSLELLLI